MSQGKREKSTRRRQPKREGSTESGGSTGGGPARGPLQSKATRTLTIDIGGTGIKVLLLDAHGKPISERARELTPKPSTPAALLRVLEKMIEQHRPFERVSVGFPGVVVRGTVRAAANLGTEVWAGYDLGKALRSIARVPVRVLNDAELQGYGVIQGRGVEMVLTFGTGIGVALYTNGHLVPNCELGHHPWKKGHTYEQRLGDATLKRIGKRRWCRRVRQMVAELEPIFNYDTLYLGGGNARLLRFKLPDNVKLFTNVDGMSGGIRMWTDTAD
jgi:polyphosphate glucokinase